MPSTFEDLLRLELQATGENQNTWGTKTNNNLELLADAIAGHVSVAVAGSGDYTLTTSNAATDEARRQFITLSGTLTGNRNIIVPSTSKTYFFRRNTSGSFNVVVKTVSGTGVTLPDSGLAIVVCDGTETYLLSVADVVRNTGGAINGIVSVSTSTSLVGDAAFVVRNSGLGPAITVAGTGFISGDSFGRATANTSVAIFTGTSIGAATTTGASRIIVESATVSASVSTLTVDSGIGIYAGGLVPVQIVSDTANGLWNVTGDVRLPATTATDSNSVMTKSYIDNGDRWVEIASVSLPGSTNSIDVTWTAGTYRVVKAYVVGAKLASDSTAGMFVQVARDGSFLTGSSDYLYAGLNYSSSGTGNPFSNGTNIFSVLGSGASSTTLHHVEFSLTANTSANRGIGFLSQAFGFVPPATSIYYGNNVGGELIASGTGNLSGLRYGCAAAVNFSQGRLIVMGLKSS